MSEIIRNELGQIVTNTSDYTPEIGDRICAEIAEGKSLRSICKMDGMPGRRTVFDWLRRHEDFRTAYDIACAERAECFAEDIIEIADDRSGDYIVDAERGITIDHENINRSRLRVDARKWVAAKMLPKKYGDRVDVEHGVSGSLAELLQAIDGKTRGLPPSG